MLEVVSEKSEHGTTDVIRSGRESAAVFRVASSAGGEFLIPPSSLSSDMNESIPEEFERSSRQSEEACPAFNNY